MAYISKEKKQELDKQIKEIAKSYGLKVTTRKEHYSTYHIIIRSGPIDFVKNNIETLKERRIHTGNAGDAQRLDDTIKYLEEGKTHPNINHYYPENSFTGKALEAVKKLIDVAFAKENGYFDKSDAMTDYFHCAWYVDISVGEWDKPYALVS